MRNLIIALFFGFTLTGEGQTLSLHSPFGLSAFQQKDSPIIPDITNNLYQWYKLNDGSGTVATDSSPQAIYGELTNNPSWGTDYLNFNGINQAIIATGDVYSLNDILSGSLTIWFRASITNESSQADGGSFLYCRPGSSDNSRVFVYESTNLLRFSIGSTTFYATNQIQTNVWYFMAFTWTNSVATVYWNGYPSITNAYSFGSYSHGTTIPIIGAYKDSTQFKDFFDGDIKDVRLYSPPLTDTQVLQLYLRH